MKNDLISKISYINQTVLDSMDADDERQIIKKFTDAAVTVLKADYGYAFFWDNDVNNFCLIYKDRNTPFESKTPRKTGITARVFKTRQPQYIAHAAETSSVRSDARKYMKGVVVIPMSYKDKNYGTLDICFRSKHVFTDAEKALCAYIGNSAAQAIALQQTYENLENLVARRTQQLKAINGKLKQDKARDDAILASIGEGLIATDKAGQIIFTNPQAQNMLGWSARDMIGKSIFSFQTLVDNKRQEIPLKKRPTYLVLKQGKRITATNFSYVSKKKQFIPLSITVTPVKLRGEIVGTIQVFRDISQEREIDQVKTELISLASHQLRTPLSAINWYTEVLMKQELGKLNSDQYRYLDQIYHANQKMVEMVYDFLNVSRLELGTFTVKLATIDIIELCHGVVREISPIITQKKLKLREVYGKGLDAVESDRKVLRLILQNLLTNAVKYTPDGGKVTVTITIDRKKHRLSMVVADTGHGIPASQQDKVFTKLFRADNAAKLDVGGSGLGLYLVKLFVDFCHGKISFTSKENRGTIFTAELPIPLVADTDES